MPVVLNESVEVHKKLKMMSIDIDRTMSYLATLYIKTGLEWGLHDEVMVEAIQTAASKKGKSVVDFLLDCASS